MAYDESLQNPKQICLLEHQGELELTFILVGNCLCRSELCLLLLKHISCTEEKKGNMCTSSTYHAGHKGSIWPLNYCVLLTKHLVCNVISTRTGHQDCCKMSLYLKKASILILLPCAHAWHTMSAINAVKASNFCFIFDNKFLKVPENHRIMLIEEAEAESTRAAMRAVKNSCRLDGRW